MLESPRQAQPDRPIGGGVRGNRGGDTLPVRYLDCLDGTPLIDVKPYLPSVDAEPQARMGWLGPHRTR